MPRGQKPKIYPEKMVQIVRRLYVSGNTQSEIATQLEVSQKVIWKLMRNHNIKARVAAKRDQFGEKNHSWKGKADSYKAKHQRVQKVRGKPKECEICGTTDTSKSYDWACINGDYDDINGFVRMCRSCHSKRDGIVKNIKGGGVRVSDIR